MARENKNMMKLLKTAVGLPPSNHESNNPVNGENKDKRTQFLKHALDDAIIGQQEKILKAFIMDIDNLPKSITDESASLIKDFVERYEMMIIDILEDIDNASLFYQLDGLKSINQLLMKQNDELRIIGIDIIRICCQNNPKCQGPTATAKMLNPVILLNLHSDSAKLREKSAACISAVIRNNTPAVDQFIEYGGFHCLKKSLIFAPGKERLILRSLFVIEALLDSDLSHRCFDGLIAIDAVEILKKILVEAEDLDLLQQTLCTLFHILRLKGPALQRAHALNLKLTCQAVGKKLADTRDDAYESGVKNAEDIYKLLKI